jgi:hypothetical protein
LTAAHRIKPTSTRCQSARQPNPGRGSTYRRGDSVQTTGTSSVGARLVILTIDPSRASPPAAAVLVAHHMDIFDHAVIDGSEAITRHRGYRCGGNANQSQCSKKQRFHGWVLLLI